MTPWPTSNEECRRKILLTMELSCKDEARIGQKTKITRRWAKRGTRPVAPCDQRTASAYIFGAICPQDGKRCYGASGEGMAPSSR